MTETLTHSIEDISLSNREIERYSRHLIMPEVGMEGQKRLKSAKVLLVGTGGLGSPIAMYLAAAGVGTIGLVDFDTVDYSNLQRQIIHSTTSVGKSKLISAKASMEAINPEIDIVLHQVLLNSSNALEIITDYDIVCDGTDNYQTRYLVNDACVLLNKVNVYGSIFRFEGQASVFDASKGPCYRCLYSEPPPPGLVPSCSEGGVLGVLPGIIGTIQANEIIKLIINQGEPLIGRLLLLDALDMEFRELKLRKNPDCLICSDHPQITELIDYDAFCGVEPDGMGLGFNEVLSAIQLKELRDNSIDHVLIDVREPHEQEISKITGALLMPQNEIEDLIGDLRKDSLIVLHCKVGVRSARVLTKLKKLGFINLKNLQGGINAWARFVDNNLPIY
jgi:adenylyltransferase/sulfurtransferase